MNTLSDFTLRFEMNHITSLFLLFSPTLSNFMPEFKTEVKRITSYTLRWFYLEFKTEMEWNDQSEETNIDEM